MKKLRLCQNDTALLPQPIQALFCEGESSTIAQQQLVIVDPRVYNTVSVLVVLNECGFAKSRSNPIQFCFGFPPLLLLLDRNCAAQAL